MKVVILEVGYSCNVRCKFCYNPWGASKGKRYPQAKVLPKRDFFHIIDKLKQWGVDTLAFSGGEPLLNPDIFEIASYSKEQGFKNSLLTNGLLVESHAREIAENFDVVQISLHGTEKTHDMLTGSKGSFQKALMGRMALIDRDVGVSAVIVVNKLNLFDLRDTIALAAAVDMSSVLVNRFLPGGKGIENVKSLGLKENELVEMLNVVEKASEDFGIPPLVGTPTPLCLEGLRSYNFLLKEGCMAGKGLHCAIDPSGGMRVCNHSPQVLGNCLTSDPEEIYETSDYVKGFPELRYTPEMCEGCDKLEKCKGGCREASHVLFGSLSAPDPLFV
jgi:radical SAM protein with 4Fe4S-binding SPASM domain